MAIRETEVERLRDFAAQNGIGLTVVGPEAQVEAGRTLKANRMLNREGKETVR